MFKITGNTIYLTRGDTCTIGMSLKDYIFQPGDIIEFKVYAENELNKAPVLSQTVVVDTECESVDIELPSEKTKIGDIVNEPVEYWYEIELNGNQTPFCYDENGPKILMLYPEGADKDATSEGIFSK